MKVALLFLCWLVLRGYAEDWPRWRGPEGNGISQEKGWNPQALTKGPKILWKTKVGDGYASVTVQGEYLYTMGNQKNEDTVYCLNAATGKKIWTHSYPCKGGSYPGTRATPTVDGTFVYTLSREGHLYCLHASTGIVQWQKNIASEYKIKQASWGLASSPYIAGDLLLVNAGKCGMAFNKNTGELVWKSLTGIPAGYATPVLFEQGGRQCVAIFGEKALYGVDLKTGKELWSYPWETSYGVNAADPIVSGDYIFISSGYEQGCALFNIKSGSPKVVWQNQCLNTHFSSSVLLNGYIYGIDGQAGSEATLKCLDFKTGEPKWSRDFGFGSLIVVEGKLIILNEAGVLILAEPSSSSCREIVRCSVLPRPKSGVNCWTPPVLSNGMIYCRNSAGDLVCVDVRE